MYQPCYTASDQPQPQQGIEDPGAPPAEQAHEGHRAAGFKVPVEIEKGGYDGKGTQGDKKEKDKIFRRIHKRMQRLESFHGHRTRAVGIFRNRHIHHVAGQ